MIKKKGKEKTSKSLSISRIFPVSEGIRSIKAKIWFLNEMKNTNFFVEIILFFYKNSNHLQNLSKDGFDEKGH